MGEGFRPGSKQVKWSRFASGLHEPLGLRLRDEEIFVPDRNGLAFMTVTAMARRTTTSSFARKSTGPPRPEFASALEVMKDGSFVVCKPGQTGSTVGRSSGYFGISPDGGKVTRWADGFCRPIWVMIPLPTRSSRPISKAISFLRPPSPSSKRAPLRAPEWDADKDRLVSSPLSWIPHQQCGPRRPYSGCTVRRWPGFPVSPFFFPSTRPGSFRSTPTRTNLFQGGVTPLPLSLDDPLLKGAVNPVDGLLYLTGFNIWGTKAKGKTFLGRVRSNPEKFCPPRSTFVPESVESFCVSPALSTPRPPWNGCLFQRAVGTTSVPPSTARRTTS